MTVSARSLGGPSAPAGLVAEEVEQFGPLAIAQAGERLRVSDAAAGQDPAGLDRADLRQHQEQVAHPRRSGARGRVGEDLRQLDLARRQIPLQLRSRRADLVCMLEGTQALFPRSARNARSCLSAGHAAILEPHARVANGHGQPVGLSAPLHAPLSVPSRARASSPSLDQSVSDPCVPRLGSFCTSRGAQIRFRLQIGALARWTRVLAPHTALPRHKPSLRCCLTGQQDSRLHDLVRPRIRL